MNFLEQVMEGKPSATVGIFVNLVVHNHENDHPFYDETYFRHALRVERMRAGRSKKPFLLLLLDISKLMVKHHQEETLASINTALIPSLREIDILGWYHNHRTIGIIFTEVTAQQDAFIDLFIHKIYNRFCEKLDPDWINKIEISAHLCPEANFGLLNREPANITLRIKNHFIAPKTVTLDSGAI